MNMRQVAMMIPSLAESDEERVGLELVVVGGADEVGEGWGIVDEAMKK